MMTRAMHGGGQSSARVCRGCGCTEDDACLVQAGLLAEWPGLVACSWWEDDLCTGCASPAFRQRGPLVDHRSSDRLAVLERLASEVRSQRRLRELVVHPDGRAREQALRDERMAQLLALLDAAPMSAEAGTGNHG